MVHYQNDYIYGTEKQKDVLPKIQNYFKRIIKENPEQYAKFDFEDESYNYELKSRKNTLNKYPDTMITLNKCNADNKGLILLFNFTDTLAYIEYDKELFKTFRTQNFSRAQQQWDMKEHIFIPINLLTMI
jgi:hypothetical protein